MGNVMPSYDYHCEANGRVVEVKHGMNETLSTWGELCERAGIEPAGASVDSPVKRLISGGQFIRSSALSNPEAPACNTGSCCPSGVCGLD